MKSRILTCITAMTLFAAIAIPILLAAPQHKNNFRHYKLIDIGTFGGPASYINAPFAQGAPNQINNTGTAVGAAATATLTPPPPPNKQICGGIDSIVPFIFHAFAWQDGEKKDLGALGASPDVECSEAVSISANGEIAGRSENGVIDPVALQGGLSVEEVRAVIWKNGKIEDLGTFGGNHSIATAINNHRQVVGYAQNTTPDPFSLLYLLGGGLSNGTQTRGFLWREGHMRDLGTLGGPDAQAFGLNDRGQVTGYSYTDFTPNPSTGIPTVDPFLWTQERGMIDLGTLGGVWGGAGPANNRGEVIGVSSVAADPGACFNNADPANCHPFLWDDGKLIDLFTQSGGVIVAANAINDAGEIVGLECLPSGECDAYLWKNGPITDLGTLPGDCFSQAAANNARGQVVGQSLSCDFSTSGKGSVFLWENGSMIDLNTFVPAGSGVQLAEALAINDRGEIGGLDLPPSCTGVPVGNDAQCGHAFLLIPVCEDGTEGCADAPLDPAVVVQSRVASGAASKTMTAEELATFKRRMARMAGQNRGFGLRRSR